MESTIERQAIRAAVVLASASAYGKTAEVISDLRDESSHLIALCVHATATAQELCGWCDDAAALVERLVAAQSIPDEQALQVSAAVLRLRLAATRAMIESGERTPKETLPTPLEKKHQIIEEPVKLTENSQKVFDFIKGHPDTRTKDLVDNFAATFSPRSAKRYLAELLALKIVRRKELEDGAVVYAVRE